MGEMNVENLAKGVILYPKGYLDKIFGEEILGKAGQLAKEGCKTIVLSFRDCPIVNSTGMAKLIELIELAGDREIELWFADLSNLHHQTFEAAGMLGLIQKTTTAGDAKTLLI